MQKYRFKNLVHVLVCQIGYDVLNIQLQEYNRTAVKIVQIIRSY